MNKEFLKLLRKILIFSIFFPLCYLFLIFVWGQTISPEDSGHLQTRLKELENTHDIDILIVGSSRAYRHYDPRIFTNNGKNIFVLGSSAQTLIQSEFLIRKYIDQLTPELVILDVYPLMFTSDGMESTLDIISNSNKNLKLGTIDLVMVHKNLRVLNLLLYSYMQEVIPSSAEEQINAEEGDLYIKGGYVQKKIKFAEQAEYYPRYSKINQNQLNSFHTILELVNDSGAKIIFVQSPMQKIKLMNYRNFPYIDSLFKSNDLPLHIFNKKVELDDSLHFYDPTHLNQAGVEIYNRSFIKELL